MQKISLKHNIAKPSNFKINKIKRCLELNEKLIARTVFPTM